MSQTIGRTIKPKILYPKETRTAEVTSEMLEVAQTQCRYLMSDLANGYPLTGVIIKAYMQGFLDCHEVLTEENQR